MSQPSTFKAIPIAVKSGEKVLKPQGFTAIRDGIKQQPDANPTPLGRKPDWLRVRLPSGGKYEQVRKNVKANRLATVCEESKCPNIGECWDAGTATIMVMCAPAPVVFARWIPAIRAAGWILKNR
jgi:lipoic acid synthetase